MKLFILPLLMSCVAAFEGVCIQAESVPYDCSLSKSLLRKKRALDEEDVINRFEMERVSPLYDIIRQFPPFEDDWIPPAFTNIPPPFTNIPSPPKFIPLKFPPTFKIDVSKDGHHVVSESGRSNGPNSALNWWYSVHSYSNVSEYNYTKSKPTIMNKIDAKTQSSRQLDEEHVFSKSPSSGNGYESFIEEIYLKSSTKPKLTTTPIPNPVETKPNITTRYILLASGRIVAINVTVSAPLKQPSVPAAFFGSRIRNMKSANITTPIRENNITATNKSMKNVLSHLKYQLPTGEKKAPEFVEVSTKISTKLFDKQVLTSQKITNLKTENFAVQTGKLTTSSRTIPTTKKSRTTSTSLPFSARNTLSVMREKVTAPSKTIATTTKSWTTSTSPPFTMKNALTAVTTGKNTLPPKNIIETIYNVLQPGTSRVPFLVVTFDSVKRNISTVPENIEIAAKNISMKRENRDKAKYFTSLVEYQKESSSKPKVLQYSYYPYQRTSPVILKGTTVSVTEIPLTIRGKDFPKPDIELLTQPKIQRKKENYSSYPLTETLPVFKHEFLRIVTLQPTSSENFQDPVVKTDEEIKRPISRGIGHVTKIYPRQQHQQRLLQQPTTSTLSHSTTLFTFPTSTRRLRQNGFHLRNSVGFQTIPSAALSDRRIYSATTPLPQTELFPEPYAGRMKIEEALAMRFEPTRKSAAHLNQKEIPSSIVTEVGKEVSPSFVRHRSSTLRPVRANTLSRPRTTTISTTRISSTETQDSNIVPRTRLATTSIPVVTRNPQGHERNFRIQEATDKIAFHSNISSSTPKPFRVYFFEPKRKSRKKTDQHEKTTNEEKKFSTENNREAKHFLATQLSTKTPLKSRTTELKRTSSRAPRTTTPLPVLQRSVTIKPRSRSNHIDFPVQPNQNRINKDVTGQFLTTNPPLTSTAVSPSSVFPKRTKKPWYSPFIRHKPNVGFTTLIPVETSFSEASSSVQITRIKKQPTPVVTEIISRSSFRDFTRIQRRHPT